MSVALTISKSKTTYLSLAVVACVAIALAGALLRGAESDVVTYYAFYKDLMEHGISGLASCEGFEPLFCGGSYVFANVTGSAPWVQLLWTCIFYLVTLYAFIELWRTFMPESPYSPISFIAFLFVLMNFVEPYVVYLLIREFVASALLMAGVARCARGRNPLLPVLLAGMIHFGSLPLGMAIFVFGRERVSVKLIIGLAVLLAAAGAVLWSTGWLDLYRASLTVKITEYAHKSDGDVNIVRDVKLILYWGLAMYAFRLKVPKLLRPYALIYLFYLCVLPNDLLHLRYHFYLIAMSWPSIFGVLYLARRVAGDLSVGLLSFRSYTYVSIISPESSLPYMLKLVLSTCLSFVTVLLSFFRM